MIFCANPSAQFKTYQSEIEAAVLKVMRSNQYVLGEEVESLEQEFASYIGVSHAIGVANGTDALELSMRALDIKPGDEVITVSHTAVATVAAIESLGAIPVLVDVEQDFYTLDPMKLSEALSKKTKAVIAVHIYGQSANLEEISNFCLQNKLFLIEDVSQAHGAKWNGSRLGSIGDIATFSCYPTKNLGAIGDAGLVATKDSELAKKVRMLREYGWENRYVSEFPGRNSRLDELQAAILRIKLRGLDRDNEKRRQIAKVYQDSLTGLDLHLPQIREGAEHVFHLYVLRCNFQKNIIEDLKKDGINLGIHYPLAVHQQNAYSNRVRTSSMEITDQLSRQVVSLPIYPELPLSDVHQVSAAIKSWVESQ